MMKMILLASSVASYTVVTSPSCLVLEESTRNDLKCARYLQDVEKCEINESKCRKGETETEIEQIDRLAKCESGRQELYKLGCFKSVCSCDADRINTWNGTEVNKCISFRNQFFANPCFDVIETMQDKNVFPIPKSNYLDLTQRNPVTYRAPLASNTTENSISTTRQIVNILVGFIVLAIIGVSILIVCLYRSSKQNRFSKSRKSEFDPKETDNQSKSVEDSHDDDLIIKKISIPEEKAKFLPENI